MYTCRWFVLCETVVHGSGTNSLTLVNTLTEIRAPEFPSMFPKFGFAALLERLGEATGTLSLRFVRKKNDENETLLTVSNALEPKGVQFYMNFPAGIRMFEPGPIEFQIEAKEGDANWYKVATQGVVALSATSPTAVQASDPPLS
ncbi:MAG: hypothetical protein MUC50_01330 [Myxococcota bacterium]|jgi:hypothetical protein|nr:hypothetical protein [Myxococcota bacterium]